MSERKKHLFKFTAKQIAEAAAGEQAYHEERLKYWQGELRDSILIIEKTAKVVIKRLQVSGGERLDLQVDYGDRSAYSRMMESQEKIDLHRKAADQYATDYRVYQSQADKFENSHSALASPVIYDLDVEDVHHFRLGGEPRDA